MATVAGWAGHTAWRTVGTLRKGHTVVVGVEKKKEKNLTMVALHFMSMVVKLVGQ